MTPAEAAALLTIASTWDQRKVTTETAVAWASVLDDLEPQDCAKAIRDHFTESTDYLMPAHIRARVKQTQRDRLVLANSAIFEPPDIDPNNVDVYRAATRARRAAIAAGQPVTDPPPELAGPKRDVQKLLDDTAARLPRVPTGYPERNPNRDAS